VLGHLRQGQRLLGHLFRRLRFADPDVLLLLRLPEEGGGAARCESGWLGWDSISYLKIARRGEEAVGDGSPRRRQSFFFSGSRSDSTNPHQDFLIEGGWDRLGRQTFHRAMCLFLLAP
jgi:hypothetical protein